MVRDALVVGINTYKHIKSLQAPAHDAEAIAHLLSEYGEFQVKRLPEVQDGDRLRVGTSRLVLRDTLKKALTDLFTPKGNPPPETALFYFSGHGIRIGDDVAEGFLLTSDSQDESKTISFHWLQKLLAKSPIQQKVVILDCCYAGEFLDFDEINPDQWQNYSYCFIAAARGFEQAYEGLKTGYSEVTKILIDGLTPDRLKSDWVNTHGLIDYLNRNLPSTATQRPISKTYGSSINLTRTTRKNDSLTKAERLAECLWTLDYTASSGYHRQLIKAYYPACSFLISAQTDPVQKWIVKRLAREIPQFLKATFIPIKPELLQLFGNGFIDGLWQQIADKLGVKRGSEDDIIKFICEKASCEPVIIALYATDHLSDVDICIQNFLIPLINEAQDHHSKKPLAGVFVYVVGNFQQSNSLKDLNSICLVKDLMKDLIDEAIDKEWAGLIRLDNLHEISVNDVADWLSHSENFKHGCTYIGEERMSGIIAGIQQQSSASKVSPEDAIRLICQTFSLDLADVEQYWKLEKAG